MAAGLLLPGCTRAIAEDTLEVHTILSTADFLALSTPRIFLDEFSQAKVSKPDYYGLALFMAAFYFQLPVDTVPVPTRDATGSGGSQGRPL